MDERHQMIRKLYDKRAHQYDETFEPTANGKDILKACNIINTIYGNGTILDIGCATGIIQQYLVGTFQFTGIDLSPHMLHRASQRGYTVIQGDIETELPKISDKSFDIVLCLGTLLYIQDINSILNHMRRIASKAVIVGLDEMVTGHIQAQLTQSGILVYDHSEMDIPDAKGDETLFAWESPTTGYKVNVRIIHIAI